MNPDAAVPARNAPCPCGSGQRYKRCCGRDAATGATDPVVPSYPGWDELPGQERAQLWQWMQGALAAQKDERLDEARRLYELVLTRAPMTGDAIHMLGAIYLQQGDLDAAEPMFARAQELMPRAAIVSQNLTLLRHRRSEQSGLHVAASISAIDTLRLIGRRRALRVSDQPGAFIPDSLVGPVHVVVPGNGANAASNQSGVALRRSLPARTDVTLWTDRPPGSAGPFVRIPHRVLSDDDRPDGGTVCLFGAGSWTARWLPAIAGRFAEIVIAIDAHDPASLVDLLDLLQDEDLGKVQLVTRTPLILFEYGLPGAVDEQVFWPSAVSVRAPWASRRRIGVFVPPERTAADGDRWGLIEWLRTQDAFVRLLYPTALPSPHLPNESVHMLSLATDWDRWIENLDSLLYWGIEGRMRQFDRLVFEGMNANLRIVADGYGDYACSLVDHACGATFFGADHARSLVSRNILS